MPAGRTYTPIATTRLSSAQANVEFSSISGSYTDLVLVVNASFQNNTPMYIRFNGDTTNTYSETFILGTGSAASSGRYTASGLGGNGILVDNWNGTSGFPSTDISGNAFINIQNYSNTTTHKTALIRAGNAGTWTASAVGLWANTAAITSIVIRPFSGNINPGSTFTLYGILAA